MHSPMSKEKVTLSFREISEAIRSFGFPEVDMVIGIATGGIYPAVLIAHQLNADFGLLHIHYRDQNNKPLYSVPKVIANSVEHIDRSLKILLVDEVSVSGMTLETARGLLKGHNVTTFVLKGKADMVLFPEIGSCVSWPWKTK